MAVKNIQIDKVAISEILVADTDLESGAEACDVDDELEEEEQQQHVSAENEPQTATSGRGLPTWGPPQGRNTNIHPFVGPAKSVKKSEAPHITVFVDVFHRNFSSAGGTDQVILPATLRHTSRT
jgi:hypothetical protein